MLYCNVRTHYLSLFPHSKLRQILYRPYPITMMARRSVSALSMSQTKEDLLRHLNMSARDYELMAVSFTWPKSRTTAPRVLSCGSCDPSEKTYDLVGILPMLQHYQIRWRLTTPLYLERGSVCLHLADQIRHSLQATYRRRTSL